MDEENNFNGENNFTENGNFNDGLLKTSKLKKNKMLIILSVVALIFVLGGVGAYAIINSNPKVKVFNALKETSDELKNKETLTEKIAGKGYLKDLEEKGMNQKMAFTLKSTNYKELAQLNGAGISIDSSVDSKNKKLMFNIGGQYNGTSIVEGQFYTDNKKLMLSVPQIYNAWFTCDSENIQNQYNNSLFAQNGKAPNKEISLKVFGDDNDKELSGKELYDAIINGYLKANAEKLTTIGKNIKVEKSKETKNIEIGGVSEACTGYNVVISGQDAKTFIESLCDYMSEDEEVKKIITRSAKYSYMQEGQKYSSPEAMVDDIYKEMKDSCEKFKKSFTCEDVNTVVYVDKKGRAVGIEFNTAINADGEKADVKYSIDFKGKDNVGDVIDMSMELSNNGEKIKIDLDNSTTNKDDIINEEMNLVLSSNNQPLNFNAKSKYNTKSGDFDASADLSAHGEGFTASCNGNTNFDKSSKTLKLDFDKIDLKSNINSEKINISLDGSYAMAPLEKTIEEPEGQKLELFKLSQNKIAEIVEDVQKNAAGLANAFK